MLCNCPQGTALNLVPIINCPFDIRQLQKAVFQRIFSTGTTQNAFTLSSANPNVKASWTTLLAASDGTKVIPSPFITAPETEPGAARMFGGGNDTLGGIEMVVGREPTAFTSQILNSDQKTIKALKNFMCETIGVYLIDQYGRIVGKSDGLETPLKIFPIPIVSFFVGDLDFGGLENPNMNAMNWSFPPNWSDDLVVIKPTDFNPLIELVSP